MKAVEMFFVGFFTVVALAIVFVQAGKQGQQGGGGGQQTSTILTGLGSALGGLGASLETGSKQ